MSFLNYLIAIFEYLDGLLNRLHVRLSKLFPWFWPSALEACNYRENPYLQFINDPKLWKKTSRIRANRMIASWFIFICSFVLVFILLGNVGYYVLFGSTLSGAMIIFYPGLIALEILIGRRFPPFSFRIVESTPFSVTDVMWGIVGGNDMNYPPGPLRSCVLALMLLISGCCLVLAGLAFVLPSVPQWLSFPGVTLLAIIAAGTHCYLFGLPTAISDGGRWPLKLYLVPFGAWFSLFMYEKLLGLEYPLPSWAAALMLLAYIPFIWLCAWLAERLPYWEIKQRMYPGSDV